MAGVPLKFCGNVVQGGLEAGSSKDRDIRCQGGCGPCQATSKAQRCQKTSDAG